MKAASGEARTRQARILVAAVAAYCVANVSGWILPDIVNEFITVNRLSESQAGFVGTVELGALAIFSMVLARFVRTVPFLVIAVAGTGAAIVFTMLSLLPVNHSLLLVLRACAGLGEGATLMVASAALAGFRDPDRAYGQMNVVNILYGTALIFSLPFLRGWVGAHGAFPTLLIGLVVLAPLVFLMPRDLSLDASSPADPDGQRHHHDITPRVYGLAASLFLIAINSSAVWSFLILLGTRSGLDPDEATQVVAMVALVSVSGSFLATIQGSAFGRLWPCIASIAVMTGCIAILCFSHDPLLYKVCAALLVSALYYLIPYFMGYAAAADDTGRGAALVGGTFLLTVALAPYTGGLLIERFGLASLAIVTFVTNAMAMAGIVLFDRDLHRHPPPDQAEPRR